MSYAWPDTGKEIHNPLLPGTMEVQKLCSQNLRNCLQLPISLVLKGPFDGLRLRLQVVMCPKEGWKLGCHHTGLGARAAWTKVFLLLIALS